jgi:RNA polymerase sigma-70 factor (ECF subfamily)
MPFMQSWEDPASSPADLAALSRDAVRLRDRLDELDERPRRSLMLAYYEGMAFEQVAGRLGAPLGTVKGWIRRSLIRLKDCMER